MSFKGITVKVANGAGFCYGVQRAYDLALDTTKIDGDRYTLGPLIHNKGVVDMLDSQGIRALPDEKALSQVNNGTVIIRSHGVGKSVKETAEGKGLNVVDATCPFVQRVHQAAEEMIADGYQLIIVGDKGHPEVEGITNTVDNKGIVIGKPEDVGELATGRYGVVVQTTQSLENLKAIISKLMDYAEDLKIKNTICTATRQRQDGVRTLAAEVDLIIVIGDTSSANTKRLVEIAEEAGVEAKLAEGPGDIDESWFRDGITVGVTAGASTPGYIIDSVLGRISEMSDAETEVNTTVSVAPVPDIDDSTLFEASFKDLEPGDIVEAYVVRVAQDEVLVDLGYKSEGVIPLDELTIASAQSAKDVVSVGDKIFARVIKIDDNEGNIVLSKKQADEEKAWDALKTSLEKGSRIKGRVTSAVKGGLNVDIGVRAFLPLSQIDRSFVDDTSVYIGNEYEFILTDLQEETRNGVAVRGAVVSRRKVLEEDYQKNKASFYKTLDEGQVLEGKVTRLTAFGAFVDIGSGVEGLIHVSELSWTKVKAPADVLKVGETVKVRVIKVEPEKERISLSLKQILDDPWENIGTKYPVDSIVEATIGNLATFGAFAILEDGVEGLIHISNLADHTVKNPAEVVIPGQKVKVKVLSIDIAAKRIGLSLKDASPKESEVSEEDLSKYTSKEQGTGATLGDLLGDILKKR